MSIKERIERFDFTQGIWKFLDLATDIESEEDAKRLYERYKAFEPKYCDQNLGYIFGYVEPPTLREKMYKLFPVNHPIFGSNFGRTNESQKSKSKGCGQANDSE